jgi:hypothetical protein
MRRGGVVYLGAVITLSFAAVLRPGWTSTTQNINATIRRITPEMKQIQSSNHSLDNTAIRSTTPEMKQIQSSNQTFPSPLQVMDQYKKWHSNEALQRDPNDRRYALGFYSCPFQAGNRFFHFMNALQWAIVTNRTLLWKYWDQETCTRYDGGSYSHKRVCTNANSLTDCDQILRRADWIPSYDDWSDTLALDPIEFPWEATHLNEPYSRNKRPADPLKQGVDLEDRYPQKVAVFRQYRDIQTDWANKQGAEKLLKTEFGRQTAKALTSWGVHFMYGMLYRESFELLERFRTQPQMLQKGPDTFSMAIHSRHPKQSNNGCDITNELRCVHELIDNISPKKNRWATIMSDRTCTIQNLKIWLQERNFTVELPLHDAGASYLVEHGPFAGVGYFQDIEYASEAYSGFAGTTNSPRIKNCTTMRSSSDLALSLMEYKRRMDAWQVGLDATNLEMVQTCVIGSH